MPETMKRLFLLSIICIFCTVQGFSMSYAEARENAYFLTDKMAYELDLTPQQYDVVYSINLDYFMSLRPTSNLRGTYWRYREQDLRYVLFDWQYSLYRTLDYFLYPVRWIYGSWYYPVTVVYRTGYYYYGHPGPYYTYGGHHWKERGRYPNGRYYGVCIARGEGMRSRYDASYHRGGRPAPPPGHAGSHDNHGKPNGSGHDNHGTRPGNDNNGTRPGNDNHGARPGNDNHGTRPGNDNHGTRPGNNNNGSRPGSSTRPSSGSSNPTISGGTYRPGRGSSTTGNSGSSRSSSKWSTSTRPTNVFTGSSTRPTSGSSTRPSSTGSFRSGRSNSTRPSSGTSTRPSSTGSFRSGRSSSSVKSSSSSRSSAGSRSSSVRSSVRSGR